METLHFETVRGHHVEWASDILKQVVVSTRSRVVPIREEIVQIFLRLTLLEQRGRPSAVWRFLCRITVPGQTGDDWHLELGDELLVGDGGRVDVVPHENHDKHGKNGTQDLKEGALGPTLPIDPIFSHERPPVATAR